MRDIILILCGALVGALTMGLASVRSYDKGYEDGIRHEDE
jgi:hypothetical protein